MSLPSRSHSVIEIPTVHTDRRSTALAHSNSSTNNSLLYQRSMSQLKSIDDAKTVRSIASLFASLSLFVGAHCVSPSSFVPIDQQWSPCLSVSIGTRRSLSSSASLSLRRRREVLHSTSAFCPSFEVMSSCSLLFTAFSLQWFVAHESEQSTSVDRPEASRAERQRSTEFERQRRLSPAPSAQEFHGQVHHDPSRAQWLRHLEQVSGETADRFHSLSLFWFV